MNQHMWSVKNIDSETINTVNALSTQEKSRTPTLYVLVGGAIVLLAGQAVYSFIAEINFSAMMSPPVKQTIAEAPQKVLVISPVYWQPVISEPKNPRLCYDYSIENYFEC